MKIHCCLLVICLWGGFSSATFAADVETLLNDIKSVDQQAQGNRQAQQAIRELLKNDDVALTTVLEAFSGANPLAVNWLRGAFESLADQRLKTTKTLPKKQLEAFVLDTRHDPRARRVAYEWLVKVDDTATSRIIPGMLNDPSVEFRRDAVARLLKQADTLFEDGKKSESQPIYEMALTGARDDDQIKSIVEKLRELGQEVDLPEHFGLLLSWKLIGPFDNSDEAGFDVSYPPETKIDPDAKYQGKDSTEVSWIDYATADDYGIVDLTKALSAHKGAVTYAYTDFVSDEDRSVELRLGTPNAWKVWVNGELVFGREEYHHGTRLDQYQFPAKLRKGRNDILIKVCQNEQKESWAQKWEFQLRVCDSVGTAVLSANRPPRVVPDEAKDKAESGDNS
jgi:hypothetical protein